jgi:soluble lytic murein transglycosylase-like protein
VSAQALGGVSTGIAAGEAAVAQRVQQLQALIEAAGKVAAGELPTNTPASPAGAQGSSGDFASALQAATADDTASGVIGSAPSGYQALAQGAGATGASGASGEAGGEYEALIDQAASRNGLDPAVLHGLIQQESGFDPSATSSAGASGLTQLMPGTASSLGVADPLDASESIEGGARYLGQLTSEFGGNTEDALAAYNAGPGAVEQYGGIPPYAETQSYVSKVLGYAESYRQSHPTTVTGALA